MTIETDIIIIGAGIAGASAASILAETASVIVLEQEAHAGYHATGRSAATWAPVYGPPAIQELTRLSRQALCAPPASLGGVPFTSPRGEMLLGRHGDEAEIECSKESGMESISIEQAKQRVPLIRFDKVSTVLYYEDMLSVDVDALHQAYLKKYRANAGTIVCNAAVTSLEYKNNNWYVTTPSNSYCAPVVINAAGAWADKVAALAGARSLKLQPKRRSAALVPFAENSNMNTWPMIFSAGETFYCTPFGNGMMISPADETAVEPHDAWPDDGDLAGAIDTFEQYIDYNVPKITHSWAGLRTFAPDGDPVVGFDPDIEGFFWLAGQGGYGIQTSPAMAVLSARLVNEYRNGKKLLSTKYADNNASNTELAELSAGTIDHFAKRLSPSRPGLGT
ncbi:hypothetical protein AB833_07565 [Chromatiales bacterium (ex Bugula neritina AB1)]|nr:hypothetical protein AB833_07565 [Chromatiales bacterium (ex Bugula neritina AB1)]